MAYNFVSSQYTLTTVLSTIFEVSSVSNGAIITELQATNKTSTSQSVAIAIDPPVGSSIYLFVGDVPPSSSIDIITGKLVLLASDKIAGNALVASNIDIVVGGVQF